MTVQEYLEERRAIEEAVGTSIMETSPARQGAAWLDEKHPGWAARIDLDTFNIEDSSNCVLGQVFEQDAGEAEDGFDYGLGKYNLDSDGLGFSASPYYEGKRELAGLAVWPSGNPEDHATDWAALQAEWRGIIIERQGA